MKIDCHDHTCYSPDSERTPREAVEEAVGLGIGVLAFTEHMDLGFPNDKRPEGELIFDYRVTRKYFEDIEALREEFRGKIEIIAGIEAGFTPGDEAETAARLAELPFEYVINSVHICHGLDCYWAGYFDGYTKERAYGEYLDAVRASLDAPYPFHTVGHLGYISRPAPYEPKKLVYEEYADKLDDILRTMIARDKILELNSSVASLEKEGEICLPHPSVLRRYRELGGKLITFGSDSHARGRMGKNYDKVAELAKSEGFAEWTIVKNGKPKGVKID